MSIDQIASALWRSRLIFVATFVACVVVVVVVTLSLPKTYKATATLYVGGKETRRALELNSALGEQLTRTYSTLAGNPNIADQARARLPIHLSRSALLARMSFVPVERTQLLQISAEGSSPRQAQTIANIYASVFVNRIAEQFARGDTQATLAINESAALPSRAVKPNPPLYVGLGGLLSLLLALGVVLVRERLDKRIRVGEDEDVVLGQPILGRIPRLASPYAEEAPEVSDIFRLFKTTLDFVGVQPAHSLMVTSPGPVEGKTKVAANLALAAAADDERVVLIEADVRRPGLAATLLARGLERPQAGLTNYLAGDLNEHDVLMTHPEYPGLHVIWAGPTPADPTSLLRSQRMAGLLESLQSKHERIIVDTPPISIGADASVIATQVETAVCIIDARNTTRSQAKAGLNQLKKVPARLLGVVMNNAETRNFNAYYPALGGPGAPGPMAPGRKARQFRTSP